MSQQKLADSTWIEQQHTTCQQQAYVSSAFFYLVTLLTKLVQNTCFCTRKTWFIQKNTSYVSRATYLTKRRSVVVTCLCTSQRVYSRSPSSSHKVSVCVQCALSGSNANIKINQCSVWLRNIDTMQTFKAKFCR